MIPLPAKVSKIQLDFSNRFSARAEVVVPEKIVYIELFDLPGGVHATNLSDVAPGKHEFLLHGVRQDNAPAAIASQIHPLGR